jgi:hypothetical protein
MPLMLRYRQHDTRRNARVEGFWPITLEIAMFSSSLQTDPRLAPRAPLVREDRTVFHFSHAASAQERTELSTTLDTPSANETFHIRFARSQQDRQCASLLVSRMYGSRAYKVSIEPAAFEEKPDRVTLLVENRHNRPMGTLTLGQDGPAGLMADKLYQAELDTLRARRGASLLELTQLSLNRSAGNAKEVLAGLFSIAYVCATMAGCNWIVISVKPRQARFYENTLGFKALGPQRCAAPGETPSVLLALDLDYAEEQIRKFGGRRNDALAGKSLYRYFLNPMDELGLIQRLWDYDLMTPTN